MSWSVSANGDIIVKNFLEIVSKRKNFMDGRVRGSKKRSTYSKVGLPAEWACVTRRTVRAVDLGGTSNAEPLLELLGGVLALEVQAHAGLTEGILGRGAQRAEHGAGGVGVGREGRLWVA